MTTASQSNISVDIDALDVKQIKSIELADGWHNVNNCDIVQFAVGVAHSPIQPDKLYPTLRYTNENGTTVRTPLSKVLSFSAETQTDEMMGISRS